MRWGRFVDSPDRACDDYFHMIAVIGNVIAGIVRGRRLTSTVGIRDDVINAGAEWVDAPSVIDGNIVSSRVPKDLPAFGKAMLEVLSKQI